MKTKSMFGILAAVMLIASFVVPSNLVSPTKVDAASDATARWAMVDTPNSLINVTKEVFNGADTTGPPAAYSGIPGGSELIKLAVSSTPGTMYLLATGPSTTSTELPYVPAPILWKTTNGGVTWSVGVTKNFGAEIGATNAPLYLPCYDIAVAPDDAKVVALVVDNSSNALTLGPRGLWVSTDGGASWEGLPLGGVGWVQVLSFFSERDGVAVRSVCSETDINVPCEDVLMRTNDGGLTWSSESTGFQGFGFHRYVFFDPWRGWFLGGEGVYDVQNVTLYSYSGSPPAVPQKQVEMPDVGQGHEGGSALPAIVVLGVLGAFLVGLGCLRSLGARHLRRPR